MTELTKENLIDGKDKNIFQNIRTVIEEEYKKTLDNLNDSKKKYAKGEAYITLKKKVMEDYFAKESARNQIIASPLLMGVLSVIGAFIIGSGLGTISPLLIKAILMLVDVSLIFVLISSAKAYRKHKRTLIDSQEELRKNYSEYGTLTLLNDFSLRFDREKQEDLRQKIYTNEVYAKGLYDILQDENLIKKMYQYNYHLYRELFKDYFESEWEEYLEEISKISSSKVHLNDREYLKEVEPIKLDFTKKREKSHNLAIK